MTGGHSTQGVILPSDTGVTGWILPPNTDFEYARVWPTYFRLRFLDHYRHTYRHNILGKMVPMHYGASELIA